MTEARPPAPPAAPSRAVAGRGLTVALREPPPTLRLLSGAQRSVTLRGLSPRQSRPWLGRLPADAPASDSADVSKCGVGTDAVGPGLGRACTGLCLQISLWRPASHDGYPLSHQLPGQGRSEEGLDAQTPRTISSPPLHPGEP